MYNFTPWAAFLQCINRFFFFRNRKKSMQTKFCNKRYHTVYKQDWRSLNCEGGKKPYPCQCASRQLNIHFITRLNRWCFLTTLLNNPLKAQI